MDLEFTGEVWEWRGPAPYHFVTVPAEESLDLRAISGGVTYGWGMIPARLRIGDTEWTTSLWPKDGGYVVPLKDVVRRAEELEVGDVVTIRLTTDASATPDRAEQGAALPPADEPRSAGSRRLARRQPAAAATRPRTKERVTDDRLTLVPANEATWHDLRAIFGASGDPSRCWCQRFTMSRGESWASVGPTELARRLREQTACGHPESATTAGLVAYLDGEPAGWCAVGPRSAHPRLRSHCPVPWVGRSEDKADSGVWALTCFVVRPDCRRRGISRALARAAVDFARRRGARALEGYPQCARIGRHPLRGCEIVVLSRGPGAHGVALPRREATCQRSSPPSRCRPAKAGH